MTYNEVINPSNLSKVKLLCFLQILFLHLRLGIFHLFFLPFPTSTLVRLSNDVVAGCMKQHSWSFFIFKSFMTILGQYLTGKRIAANQDTPLQSLFLRLDLCDIS